MTIQEIYEKFGIPPNLSEHMLTVTKVCLFLKDHWIGPELDWEKVTKTALLHDLGNIIRFDFDKHLEFWGDEAKRIDYWKSIQKQTIEKYGEEEHAATEKMLQEVGIDQETITTILNKTFGNSVKVSQSEDWYSKILLYADMRVMPFGVSTLEERMEDIRNRIPKYSTRVDFGDLVNACKEIEKQIQENINVPVSEITKVSVERKDEGLLNCDVLQGGEGKACDFSSLQTGQ